MAKDVGRWDSWITEGTSGPRHFASELELVLRLLLRCYPKADLLVALPLNFEFQTVETLTLSLTVFATLNIRDAQFLQEVANLLILMGMI